MRGGSANTLAHSAENTASLLWFRPLPLCRRVSSHTTSAKDRTPKHVICGSPVPVTQNDNSSRFRLPYSVGLGWMLAGLAGWRESADAALTYLGWNNCDGPESRSTRRVAIVAENPIASVTAEADGFQFRYWEIVRRLADANDVLFIRVRQAWLPPRPSEPIPGVTFDEIVLPIRATFFGARTKRQRQLLWPNRVQHWQRSLHQRIAACAR